MSDIFTKLLESDQRQKQQLQQEVAEIPQTKEGSQKFSPVISSQNPQSDETTLKQPTERAAFDLYASQIQAIRRLRAEREIKEARKIGLSDIAREAFDLYLQKNSNNHS